jgi:hypothetical protein
MGVARVVYETRGERWRATGLRDAERAETTIADDGRTTRRDDGGTTRDARRERRARDDGRGDDIR